MPEQFPARGLDCANRRRDPIGLRQNSGKDVGDVNKGRNQEYLFHALVLAFDHYEPDNHGADRNGDVLGKAE